MLMRMVIMGVGRGEDDHAEVDLERTMIHTYP